MAWGGVRTLAMGFWLGELKKEEWMEQELLLRGLGII